jgi:hypothetical protein
MRAPYLRASVLAFLGCALVSGCDASVVPTGLIDTVGAQPPPTGGDGGSGGGGAGGAATAGPPTVSFTAPADKSEVAASVVFQGVAASSLGVASVFVAVGPNVPVAAQSGDDFQTWTVTLPVPPGTFTVTATAYDVAGVPADKPAQITLTLPTTLADTQAPTLAISSPADKSTPLDTTVLVQGTAGDDRGVVKMELRRNDELLTERPIETQDFFAHWDRLVTLLPGEDNKLVFSAYDAAGHRTDATLTLTGAAATDKEPPTVAVASPAAGATVMTDTLMVSGSAFDNKGVGTVKVRIGTTPAGATEPTWSAYAKATTMDGFAHWGATLPIPTGAFVLQARAIDVSGLAAVAEVKLTSTFVPEWSDEQTIPLRVHDGDPAPMAHLELDRKGVNAIINTDLQKQTQLLDLDPTPLLQNALGQIKTACGTAWQQDNQDPQHDCTLTPLGQTFHGPDGTWQTSAEYSLVRLLTMTSANVVVKGTSIAGLQNIADGAILGIKIGGGFNQVLAETLGIERTREIVSTDAAAKALRDEWMASHPKLGPVGNIPVTLYDAMNDLTPLADVLGPSGDHPGIVDPSQPPHSQVFGDDFKLVLDATSNLVWRDGLVLAKGKDYIAVIHDTTGPTFDDVLEFDFNDPARFDVLGLTPAPTVDLRMKILENNAFIDSCAGSDSCQQNLPGAPVDGSSLWATPRWQLEHIVGRAAYNDYKTRVYDDCLIQTIGCQAEVSVGWNGDPPGWTKFDILFNLGNPPKNQYLWELISEVGQVALHNFKNTVVPEGNANVAFTLAGVPVGLTADQIRQAVRPSLQAQASQLSSGLLGDYAKNNGPVDLFYQLGQDGQPYLYFIAATDPRPIATYSYAHPGFFSDQQLTQKISTTDMGASGDTAHEKLKLSPGDSTVYAQDNQGKLYRLRITVPTGAAPEIAVRLSSKL